MKIEDEDGPEVFVPAVDVDASGVEKVQEFAVDFDWEIQHLKLLLVLYRMISRLKFKVAKIKVSENFNIRLRNKKAVHEAPDFEVHYLLNFIV